MAGFGGATCQINPSKALTSKLQSKARPHGWVEARDRLTPPPVPLGAAPAPSTHPETTSNLTSPAPSPADGVYPTNLGPSPSFSASRLRSFKQAQASHPASSCLLARPSLIQR